MKTQTINLYVILRHFLILFISLTFLLACSSAVDQTDPETIKGVYGNPSPIWEKGYTLKNLGVNSIFVHSGSINREMINRARKEGLKVYSEFATLNGKNYVDDHPDAWPINEKGEKADQASWFMGVCPNNAGFREYRFNQLRELLNQFELDGIWMDYVHWHAQFEEPEPILPETCFCEDCLTKFRNDTQIDIPEGNTASRASWILTHEEDAWRDWRCSVIREWVVEFRKIMDDTRPGLLLGIYHCPWNDREFDGARRRILGLDYDILKSLVDVFSPMVYHGRMGRSPEWVADNINWFCDRLSIQPGEWPKVWSIVQAYDDPYPISPDEFETVLRGGLTGCSSGVMMFTTYAMAESEKKIRKMKEIYMETD